MKKYSTPELEVVKFSQVDIILSSGGGSFSSNSIPDAYQEFSWSYPGRNRRQ